MGNTDNGAAQAAPLAPTGHSRFGASGAHRWTVCTGSVLAQEGLPNDSSEYAAEGTALHALSAHCLETGQDAAEWIDRAFKYDDHGEAKTLEADEDQAEAVQVYLDAVRKDRDERGGRLLIETRFHLPEVHEEAFGTSDVARIGKDQWLSVYDAKFGRGKIVEPYDVTGPTEPAEYKPNKQLGFYALGVLRTLARVIESLGGIAGVELFVVQPRAWHRDGPVRHERFTVAEIEALGAELHAKAAEALASPQLIAGDHCTFCRAAPTCKAIRDFAMETAQMDFDDDSPPVSPPSMSPEALARALDRADVIQTWISAVRARAHALADADRVQIPGYALKTTQGHRKWRDAAAAEAALCFDFGLDRSSIIGEKLLSPAQVEKKLPKQERGRLADLLADRSTKTTLVRASNPDATAAPAAQMAWDDGLSQPEGSEW